MRVCCVAVKFATEGSEACEVRSAGLHVFGLPSVLLLLPCLPLTMEWEQHSLRALLPGPSKILACQKSSSCTLPDFPCHSGVPQMFNVSYPGAPPNLNRPSMLGVAPGTPGAEGSATEGTAGSPKRDKDNMFRCPICFEDLHKDDVFVASMCGHEMCRGCARQMVLTAIRYPGLKVLIHLQ